MLKSDKIRSNLQYEMITLKSNFNFQQNSLGYKNFEVRCKQDV